MVDRSKQQLAKFDIEHLDGVALKVVVRVGSTRMLVQDLLQLGPASIIQLDQSAGSLVDIMVGDRIMARGEVVVINERFGVRILEILEPKGALPKAS